MKLKILVPLFLLLNVSSCKTTKNNSSAKISERPPISCSENSPERRGEEGCTILANKLLIGTATNNLYWHLDRFDSLATAMKAAGDNGVAAEAHGSFWLMTVEAQTEDHHGGHHVASIGPLVLPVSDTYLMRVQSSLLMPGSTTPVHTHSGPEAIYIVDGEQCMEMPETGVRLSTGQSYVVPSGGIHHGVVTGSVARKALGLVLYDATRPASYNLENSTKLTSCK